MGSFRYFVLSELRRHFPMNISTGLLLIRIRAATLAKMEALFYEKHKNYQKNGIRVRPRCTKESFFNRSR